jgi:hypothetical protein
MEAAGAWAPAAFSFVEMIRGFVAGRPELWNEDIGV